jgi:hypothetical protein
MFAFQQHGIAGPVAKQEGYQRQATGCHGKLAHDRVTPTGW